MSINKRCGVIARKIGITSIYDETGNLIPVTVLHVHPNFVTAVKKESGKDNYNAVQLASIPCKMKKIKKPQKNDFKNIHPQSIRKEFRVSETCLLDLGTKVDVRHFVIGQFVDVRATSKGKGFAGAMKRHNFAGLRASHGVSLTHRSMGSTGHRTDPSKVFKGKKMPGHLGAETVSVQNLKVVEIDVENNLILVKGSVPGYEGSIVNISDAVKRKTAKIQLPVPTFIETDDTSLAKAE